MFQKYFFIVNYAVIIIFGLYHFRKFKNCKPLKLFLGFIIYSFLTESLATFLLYEKRINVSLLYNLWNINAILFYFYFFWNFIKSNGKRFAIGLFTAICILLYVGNALFYQNILEESFRNIHIVGKLFISVVVIFYFSEILSSDAILNFKKSLTFWVALGVFIYALGLIPIFVMGKLIGFMGVYRYVIILLNILMALSFITGFIVSKKEYNG